MIESKTSIASAERPAPPATAVSTPGWALLSTWARAWSTGRVIVSPSPLAWIWAVSRAAVWSFERIGLP